MATTLLQIIAKCSGLSTVATSQVLPEDRYEQFTNKANGKAIISRTVGGTKRHLLTDHDRRMTTGAARP